MRLSRRAWTIGLTLAVLGAVGWALPEERAARAAPADAAGRWRGRQPKATLLLTGRNQGRLKPCGCTSPQMGGYERMAVLIEILRTRSKGALAAVALGGMAPRPSADSRAIAQLSLKAELHRAVIKDLGFSAALLSMTDLYVNELVTQFEGPDSAEVDRPRPPLNVKPSPRLGLNPASANVPWVELRLGDVPLRLLGVIDGSHGENLTATGIADYVSTPATVLQGLQPNPHVLWIVAVEGGGAVLAEARDAARLLGPAVIVDLSGSTPETAHEFVVLGKEPLVVSFQEKGMGVGVLDLDPGPDGKGWTVSYHPQTLGPDLDAVPSEARKRVSSLFDFYRGQVRAQGLLDLELRRPEPEGSARFVGSAACAKCHSGIYQEWSGTHHAKALFTLKKHDYDSDPECLTCHVVGPQVQLGGAWHWPPSGFRGAKTTPFLGGVGCESCHGPGSLHVAEPWKKEHFAEGGPNRRHPQIKGCMTCHDVENSPGFYEQYAERVTHVDHRDVPKDRRTHPPAAR